MSLYEQAIVEHARKPRNFGPLERANRHAEGSNPLCGDELTLHLRVGEGLIEAVRFEGAGCAVCLASASMMTVAVEGRSLLHARELARRVERLAGGAAEDLGAELNALAGVAKFPARVKCALLAWRALLAALDGAPGAVSTEL